MATRIVPGRAAEITIGADGIITAKIFDEDSALYNSNAIGDKVVRTGYPNQSVSAPGSTVLRLMDIATLNDKDDGPGFYAAVRGISPSWPAAILFESDDDTADYRQIKTFDQQAVMGFAKTVLADGPTTIWDYDGSVEVELLGGALESLSDDEALKGESAYLVGSEILICQGVTQLSATRWRLDGPMARGWKGTEWATAGHKINEAVIALNATTIQRINDALSDIGLSRNLKAVTSGTTIEAAQAKAFTDTGVSLKPWAPVDIDGTLDGSDNVVLTWRRRSRLQGRNGRDFYDPPLGEATESYEIDILSDDELTVKRTLTATSETVSYSNANQVTDFGATKEFNLHVNVHQISADVGRGYAGHAVLNPIGLDDGENFSILGDDGVPLLGDDDEYLIDDRG